MEPKANRPTADSKLAQQDLRNHVGQTHSQKPIPDKVAQPCATFQIIRMPRMCKRLDVGKTTVYDWLNPKSPRHDPTFPVPIKLSVGGAIGWIESEVDAWLASRVRAKYNS